jgi:hypothetical protein
VLFARDGSETLAKPLEMIPAKDFNELVESAADRALVPAGWNREGSKREWIRPWKPWATAVVEFRSLKGGGVSVRWGLRFSFVPRIKARSRMGDLGPEKNPLHLSYDPTDYERSTRDWAISRFSLRDEIPDRVRDLAGQARVRCNELAESCTENAEKLLGCFEERKDRPAVAFSFVHYPHEVLAYCTVLGWFDREEEAAERLRELIERSGMTVAEADRMFDDVRAAWSRGTPE